MERTILCYGDSNTWGCEPRVHSRFPRGVRWPGVMRRRLGDAYEVMEDGVKGRTTAWDDPGVPCSNGLAGLGYALCRAKPLDLVIVMLGTNDVHHADADGFGKGLARLADCLLHANEAYPGSSPVFRGEARALLVSPILLYPALCPPDADAAAFLAASRAFAAVTERVASSFGFPWMDAAASARASDLQTINLQSVFWILLNSD